MKFIADALSVFTEDGELIIEALARPTSGWDTAVMGSCRVALSSDAPDKPYAVQKDCTGDATIKTADVNGKTEYWCECC